MNELIINDSICQSTAENIGEIWIGVKPKVSVRFYFDEFVRIFIQNKSVLINAPPAL